MTPRNNGKRALTRVHRRVLAWGLAAALPFPSATPIAFAQEVERPAYADYRRLMTSYRDSLDLEAMGYVAGGILGAGLSLHLASRDKETLPRLAAAAVAGTATLAALHGASLAARGDALTALADDLARTEALLSRTPLTDTLRERVMDRLLLERLVALKRQRDSTRLVNAAIGLTAAAGGGAALAASRGASTAGRMGLALFTLTTGVFGLASLVPHDGAAGLSALRADGGGVDFAPGKITVAFQGAALGFSVALP